MPHPLIFDRRLLRAHRVRAAARDPATFLIERTADDLAGRLSAVLRKFDLAVDLGTPTDAARRALAGRVGAIVAVDPVASQLAGERLAVAADEEALPFRDASLDLVVSALALQFVNDLPGTLIQIRRALRPDGLFLAAMIGGDSLAELREAFAQIAEDRAYSLRDYFTRSRFSPAGKKQVAPKSAMQRRYIETIQQKDIVFGIGPAGTGKTYLGVAMAVQALMQKQVNRIVLARPAVEAGEKLGFLPGDLQEKVDPYLRPLYDALFDLVDYERVTRLLEKRVIEIAPLAFMRGRTLSDAFVILDEAQNTTSEQMKMFLTRIGFGSKAVITGDVTQIDLPTGKRSGLVEAERVLAGIEGIDFVYFTDKDVVRHKLVQMIIKAYESHTKKSEI